MDFKNLMVLPPMPRHRSPPKGRDASEVNFPRRGVDFNCPLGQWRDDNLNVRRIAEKQLTSALGLRLRLMVKRGPCVRLTHQADMIKFYGFGRIFSP